MYENRYVSYGKTKSEMIISEVQKAVKALIKAYGLLEGHEVLSEEDVKIFKNIIETCSQFLYDQSVEVAKEKYLHGKPLC